jgi:signal transduction histidine kinase/CheY-like chemotaxis protein
MCVCLCAVVAMMVGGRCVDLPCPIHSAVCVSGGAASPVVIAHCASARTSISARGTRSAAAAWLHLAGLTLAAPLARRRLQVVTNYGGNACKFGARNVQLRLTRLADGADARAVPIADSLPPPGDGGALQAAPGAEAGWRRLWCCGCTRRRGVSGGGGRHGATVSPEPTTAEAASVALVVVPADASHTGDQTARRVGSDSSGGRAPAGPSQVVALSSAAGVGDDGAAAATALLPFAPVGDTQYHVSLMPSAAMVPPSDPAGVAALEGLGPSSLVAGEVTWLRLEVVDDGRGVAAGQQGSLFQPWQQVAGMSGADHGGRVGISGTGLGLYLCRELAVRHGGRVGMTSEPGVRTVFWLEVPVRTVRCDGQDAPFVASRAAGADVRTAVVSPVASRARSSSPGGAAALPLTVGGDRARRGGPSIPPAQDGEATRITATSTTSEVASPPPRAAAGAALGSGASSAHATSAAATTLMSASASPSSPTAGFAGAVDARVSAGRGGSGVPATFDLPSSAGDDSSPSSPRTPLPGSPVSDANPDAAISAGQALAGRPPAVSLPSHVTAPSARPLTWRGAAGASHGPSPRHAASLLPLTALAVDDDASIRKLMARRLGRLFPHGRVLAAENGRLAIDALLAERAAGRREVDFVCLDANMPVMSGYEAAAALRSEHGYGGLIIGVTGNAMAEDVARFRACGCDAVLSKPVDFAEVARFVVQRLPGRAAVASAGGSGDGVVLVDSGEGGGGGSAVVVEGGKSPLPGRGSGSDGGSGDVSDAAAVGGMLLAGGTRVPPSGPGGGAAAGAGDGCDAV